MRVYIAAPIFNAEQVAVVETIKELVENRLEAEVFSPYHASREIWKGRAPKDCSPEERAQVLSQNVEYLAWCDVLIAWINRGDDGYDGRPDTGVVWEMGYVRAIQDGAFDDTIERTLPVTIAYVHPHTPVHRKGINLMLTGTVNALVTDLYQLQSALEHVRDEKWAHLSTLYSPSRDTFQERDQIR